MRNLSGTAEISVSKFFETVFYLYGYFKEDIMSELNIGTKCVQGGYTPGNGEPREVPIIQSTTFKYSTSEDMGKLFDL